MSTSEMDTSDGESSRSSTPTQRGPSEMEKLRRENEDLKTQMREMTKTNRELVKQVSELSADLKRVLGQLEKLQKVDRPQTRQEKRRKEDLSGSDEDKTPPKKAAAAKAVSQGKNPRQDQPSQTPGPSTAEPTTPQPDAASPAAPLDKIPPVILRKKDKWSALSGMLKANNINFTRAKLTSEGIAVTPASVADHRKMTKILFTKGEEFHTYTLQEEKKIRAVIRGIPSGIPIAEVEEDLRSQGFAPTSVTRMTSRKTKQEMPLVLVQMPQDQGHILEVRRCCSLVVRVEPQKEAKVASQCHRCQKFGHGQSRCTAQVRCVKCGEGHHSGECKKPRDAPAKCANCGGPHPASYRGCPSVPQHQHPRKRTTEEPKQTKSTASPGTTEGRSFADAARQKQAPAAAPRGRIQNQQQRGATPAEFANALARMQEMCSAMTAIFTNMPSLFQA